MFSIHPKLLFSRSKIVLLVIISYLCVVAAGCGNSTGNKVPAFYYWQNSNWHLSLAEWKSLNNAKARVLYVKFFEVSPDPLYTAIPIAKTELRIDDWRDLQELDSISGGPLEVIPCVFVLNATLKSIRSTYIDTLADNIVFLIHKYYRENFKLADSSFNEIQIDCDWTLSTREAYFKLLTAIKEKSNLKLSCTLRLYPYAYPRKMGIPPVDRVTLMCYNLLNLREEKERNSILDIQELEKYLKEADDYPLAVDIALPLFSWAQIYKDGKLVDLVEVSDELKTMLIQKKGYWYELTDDYEAYNLYLRKGEQIKIEEVTFKELQTLSKLLQEHVQLKSGARISLFRLDESTLKQYSDEQISSIYASFN
jgi:hypothetical protein